MYAESMLGLTQNFLSPDIVNKFSSAIGESTEKTQKAIKSVVPALLLGIVDKGKTPDGAKNIVNLAQKDGLEDDNSIQDFNDQNILSKGNDAVEGIFGNNLENVVSKLEHSTGMQSSGIKKMLGMAAPLVMGFIGKKIKNDGLSSSGLMGFLGQQKFTLTKLVPDGLIGRQTSERVLEKQIRSPWITITLFALAVLAALWWYTGRQTAESLSTTPGSVVTASMNDVGEVTPLAEPSLSPNVDEITAFIQSGSAVVPQTFSFSNLNFNTGTAALMAGSEIEIDLLAKVMTDFPQMQARIEGHTDNTGLEATNRELSAERANTLKQQLVARGIESGRIEIAGLGSGSPIVTNNTEEGRALNRRIEFVLTKIE
jgi:OOP family OmpA-OmpF porin